MVLESAAAHNWGLQRGRVQKRTALTLDAGNWPVGGWRPRLFERWKTIAVGQAAVAEQMPVSRLNSVARSPPAWSEPGQAQSKRVSRYYQSEPVTERVQAPGLLQKLTRGPRPMAPGLDSPPSSCLFDPEDASSAEP